MLSAASSALVPDTIPAKAPAQYQCTNHDDVIGLVHAETRKTNNARSQCWDETIEPII